MRAGASAERIFNELGNRIDDAWRAENYDEAVFHRIAEEHLRGSDLLKSVDLLDIANWVCASRYLPAQHHTDVGFGEPPIGLYASRRFFIEALVWMDGTTSVHQHAIDGAFAVLQGGSVHSTYDFHQAHAFNQHLGVGDVVFQNAEILKQGDVRAIRSGPAFIHALFHLERPSVSIVVRTIKSALAPPQYNYDPPYVFFNPFDHDLRDTRLVQYAKVLAQTQPDEHLPYVRRALAAMDLWGAHKMLPGADEPDGARQEAIVAAVSERFGPWARPVIASWRRSLAIAELAAMRRGIKNIEQRFFLALLMNVPDRRTVVQLVRDVFPGVDPAARVTSWVQEICSDSCPVAPYTLEPDAVRLVELMLRDLPFDEICRALAKSGAGLRETEVAAVRAAIAELHQNPILAPLFGERPPMVRELLPPPSER